MTMKQVVNATHLPLIPNIYMFSTKTEKYLNIRRIQIMYLYDTKV